MSHASDERAKTLAIAAAKMRKLGFTNKDIARQLGCDVKSVPGKVKTGETLLTLREGDA